MLRCLWTNSLVIRLTPELSHAVHGVIDMFLKVLLGAHGRLILRHLCIFLSYSEAHPEDVRIINL